MEKFTISIEPEGREARHPRAGVGNLPVDGADRGAVSLGSATGTGNPVRIRPIQPADFSDWLPLWDGYNAFYGRSGPTALPLEITETTWRRFFDPASRSSLW